MGVVIFIVDRIDFKAKAMIRDKGHCIMIKETIQQESTTLINIYVPNIQAPKYVKQILIHVERLTLTVIVGDFNTVLTSMDRSCRPKIKETVALNDALHQMELIGIFR